MLVMTPGQLSNALGMSINDVESNVQAGMPHVRFPTGHVVFIFEDVVEWGKAPKIVQQKDPDTIDMFDKKGD